MRFRSFTRLGLAAVGLTLLVAPNLQGQAGRAMTLEDYYRIKNVGTPAISPDGNWVAYAVTSIVEEANEQHSEIWLTATDGSTAPQRITSPGVNASNPQWSPDGALLVFSSSRPGGDGQSSVWFLHMDRPAGEAFQIEGVGGTPIMSPDNRWIAFTKPTSPASPPAEVYTSEFEQKTVERFDGRTYDWMGYRFDRRGYLPDPRDPNATPPRELYVVPRDGGAARQITDIGVNVQGATWSGDGRSFAFTADTDQRNEHTYERADVWAVNLSGEVTRLTDDEFNYSSPAWSPDGRSLVVRGAESLDIVIREGRDHGAPSDLFLIPTDGSGAPRNITAEWDLMPGAATWSPDGRYIYFGASVSGDSHLFRLRANGGDVEQITNGDRRLNGFAYSAGFNKMTYRVADPTRPGDIYTSDLDGGDELQLSAVNRELLADIQLSTPDNVHYASEDGTEIEGWVLSPRNYDATRGSYPLVLTIHGGPHGAYGNSFSFEHQLLAANGYMVVYTNPRASTGYGEDFRWAIWGGWGFRDYEDIMAGVDHVLEHYPVDSTRMGVTGYSYGGYMTNWVITHTNRFGAAVAGASISNWVSDYGTADIPRTKESEFFGPPWEEKSLELLLRSSPIIYAGDATTPTMFVHGEYDHRVPIEEAEQMYTALQKNGVPAKFVRYPESYHGGWTPWRYVHRMYVQMEWWKEWLSEGPTS